MVLGSSPVAVTSPSDFAPASSKEFLDIQATIECGFTLKRVRDMTRTYSYIYEGAKYDKSSGIAGAGYNVVQRLMEMGKLLDNCHHSFTDNLFTTYAAARGTFMTRTMRQNQLQHIPNKIITAKPRVGEKVY